MLTVHGFQLIQSVFDHQQVNPGRNIIKFFTLEIHKINVLIFRLHRFEEHGKHPHLPGNLRPPHIGGWRPSHIGEGRPDHIGGWRPSHIGEGRPPFTGRPHFTGRPPFTGRPRPTTNTAV